MLGAEIWTKAVVNNDGEGDVQDARNSEDVVGDSVQGGSPRPRTKRDAENDHVWLAWPDDIGLGSACRGQPEDSFPVRPLLPLGNSCCVFENTSAEPFILGRSKHTVDIFTAQISCPATKCIQAWHATAVRARRPRSNMPRICTQKEQL